MMIEMMKAKIHNMAVTDKDLHYTGSLGIDVNLMEAAGILPFEKIQVINLVNGERMWTYAIGAEPGSGQIVFNGGMAQKGEIGDRVLIIAYVQLDAEDLVKHHPQVVIVGEDNGTWHVQDA